MNVKFLSKDFGDTHPDLFDIFYDEAKRISIDEQEAISLTRDAIKFFKKHKNGSAGGSDI